MTEAYSAWRCGRCRREFTNLDEAKDHMENGDCTPEMGPGGNIHFVGSAPDVVIPRTPAGTLDIPALMGFKPVSEVVAEHTCRVCGSDVDPTFAKDDMLDSFRAQYAQEYQMSGLCRGCQDEVFRPAPEDEEYNQGEMP